MRVGIANPRFRTEVRFLSEHQRFFLQYFQPLAGMLSNLFERLDNGHRETCHAF
jgi:hypothetical protein